MYLLQYYENLFQHLLNQLLRFQWKTSCPLWDEREKGKREGGREGGREWGREGRREGERWDTQIVGKDGEHKMLMLLYTFLNNGSSTLPPSSLSLPTCIFPCPVCVYCSQHLLPTNIMAIYWHHLSTPSAISQHFHKWHDWRYHILALPLQLPGRSCSNDWILNHCVGVEVCWHHTVTSTLLQSS